MLNKEEHICSSFLFLYMKHIDSYISEKLYIGKGYSNKFDTRKYLVVLAYHDAFVELNKKYEDNLFDSPSEPSIFVLPEKDALEYKDVKDVTLYYLPDNYSSIEDFKDDYNDGNLTIEDDFEKYED